MDRRKQPMSLHRRSPGPIPEETARVAHASFPKGNTYMQMRDVLGTIYDDARFASLFPSRGRPAEAPWRLALITVMQFAEGLSDRQAAAAVRARIDWKYALGLELTDAGFDFSVLSEFRARLVAGAAAHLLLDTLLMVCNAHGFLKMRGRQRTDSTHVLGALRMLNRLERVAETLRAALNAVAIAAPEWLRDHSPADWFARYDRRTEEYRGPMGCDSWPTSSRHRRPWLCASYPWSRSSARPGFSSTSSSTGRSGCGSRRRCRWRPSNSSRPTSRRPGTAPSAT
jgi:transposase